MKYLLLAVALLYGVGLWGQNKPDFLPEDLNYEGLDVRCFCKPGIRNRSRSKGLEIAYTQISKGTFKPEEGELALPYSTYNRVNYLEIDLKAPLINKPSIKVLLGYKYFSENYNFDLIGADFSSTFQDLDDHLLKSNSLSLYVTRPLNETHYLAFRLRYSANGNYQNWINFDSKYAIYRGLAVFGIKPNEDLEWGFGLSFSQSFRSTFVVPFFVYNRNFNDHWGMESVLPASIQFRYNINPQNLAFAGIKYGSQSYRLQVADTPQSNLDYALNHSELITSATLEHQFSRWVWASAEVGYQMNFSTDFESKSDLTPGFKVEPTNGVFLRLGIFISPPDDLFE